MATFKACVQKERKDGFYPVYIRVTHHRGTQFMKTDKMVTKKELSRAKEIEDPYVLQYCAGRIITSGSTKKTLNIGRSRKWWIFLRTAMTIFVFRIMRECISTE